MLDMFDHIAAPAPLSKHGIKPEGLISRAVDWIFGHDFFVSYSYGNGMRLPQAIKERLEQAGFASFSTRRSTSPATVLGGKRAVKA